MMHFHAPGSLQLAWQGEQSSIALHDEEAIRQKLLVLDKPVWIIEDGGQTGITNEGTVGVWNGKGARVVGFANPLPVEQLGDPSFNAAYSTRCAFYAGAMANGIASEQMVIALGKAGLMGSFGAGGLSPARIEAAIRQIKEALGPIGPYAFNLINSPNEPAMEQRAAELFVRHNIRTIEASAYLALTVNLVYYRAAGLALAPDGTVVIGNRVIAKLSRKEVAVRFLEPAPADILQKLVSEGRITQQQANLARLAPMADDITVEGDSGGHTDNRPLVGLIPTLSALRDEVQAKNNSPYRVRVGAAGGISTPESALAAFMMGAAFVVTGSINQACVESGASDHTKTLLAQAEMTDVSMAPAGDMFEMGVKVQVLKRGTMFAQRAQRLYEIYSRYDAWEEVPQKDRERLETQTFKRDFNAIWEDTVKFFTERDPRQIERANRSPKDKMALVFRWYLGLSSRWSNNGEKGREMDYQIWCGPAIGPFNNWVRGTCLADPLKRGVAEINLQLLTGCAYLYRLRLLQAQGVLLQPHSLEHYAPVRNAD